MDDHVAPQPEPLAALTAALAGLMSSLLWKHRLFEWSDPEQYDEFQLFFKSLNSLF